MQLSCDAYGGNLLGQSSSEITSRQVAADLLDRLSDKSSPFTVMESPKTLELSQFMSADPGKSAFTTKTSFTLKLKFSPNTQM